jgi:nitroreductase
VKDPETKRRVQHCYALAYEQHVKPRYDRIGPAPGMDDAGHRRQVSSVAHLTEHFHEAPVWIVACLDTRERPPNAAAGASIDPAVQNMLLTARALGLDATLTTRHTMHGAEVDEIFGLPPNDHSLAIVPIGHPIGAFGPERRAPLGTVVHGDRWGAPPAFEGLGGAGGE